MSQLPIQTIQTGDTVAGKGMGGQHASARVQCAAAVTWRPQSTAGTAPQPSCTHGYSPDKPCLWVQRCPLQHASKESRNAVAWAATLLGRKAAEESPYQATCRL